MQKWKKALTGIGYYDKVSMFEESDKMRKQTIHSHPVAIGLTGVSKSSNLVEDLYTKIMMISG